MLAIWELASYNASADPVVGCGVRYAIAPNNQVQQCNNVAVVNLRVDNPYYNAAKMYNIKQSVCAVGKVRLCAGVSYTMAIYAIACMTPTTTTTTILVHVKMWVTPSQPLQGHFTKSTNKNVTRFLSQWRCTISQQETVPDFCQPNDWRKRWDLVCRRNVSIEEAALVCGVRLFHARAAATGNARSRLQICYCFLLLTPLLTGSVTPRIRPELHAAAKKIGLMSGTYEKRQ